MTYLVKNRNRDNWEMLRLFEKCGLDNTKQKREVRAQNKPEHQKPFLQRLMDGETIAQAQRDDGECWTEYTLFENRGETDGEINEYTQEMEQHINSMYDCTGRAFTRWITWKRLPIGILVIHYKGLDV